jgi:hypothetical protein
MMFDLRNLKAHYELNKIMKVEILRERERERERERDVN